MPQQSGLISPLTLGKSLSYIMSKKHSQPITDDYLAMLTLLIPLAETNIPYEHCTPLMLAPNTRIVRILLTHGAQIDFANEPDSQTPLMLNIKDAEITRELIRAGANVDAIDKKARTALDFIVNEPAQVRNARYLALRYLEHLYEFLHDSPRSKLEKYVKNNVAIRSAPTNRLFVIKPHHLKAIRVVYEAMDEICGGGSEFDYHFLVYFLSGNFKEKVNGLIGVLEASQGDCDGGEVMEKNKNKMRKMRDEFVNKQKKILEEFYGCVTNKDEMEAKLRILCEKLIGVSGDSNVFEERVEAFLEAKKKC